MNLGYIERYNLLSYFLPICGIFNQEISKFDEVNPMENILSKKLLNERIELKRLYLHFHYLLDGVHHLNAIRKKPSHSSHSFFPQTRVLVYQHTGNVSQSIENRTHSDSTLFSKIARLKNNRGLRYSSRWLFRLKNKPLSECLSRKGI